MLQDAKEIIIIITIQCILCNVLLKIANYILRRSNVKNPLFDSASDVDYSTFDGRTSDVEYSTFDEWPIECRKSDIRRRALLMSNIRHSKDGRSYVENPTSEEGRFGCQIFDIRRRVLRMSNIRHSTVPNGILKIVWIRNFLNINWIAFEIWPKYGRTTVLCL